MVADGAQLPWPRRGRPAAVRGAGRPAGNENAPVAAHCAQREGSAQCAQVVPSSAQCPRSFAAGARAGAGRPVLGEVSEDGNRGYVVRQPAGRVPSAAAPPRRAASALAATWAPARSATRPAASAPAMASSSSSAALPVAARASRAAAPPPSAAGAAPLAAASASAAAASSTAASAVAASSSAPLAASSALPAPAVAAPVPAPPVPAPGRAAPPQRQQPVPFDDAFADDARDIQQVAEYADGIFAGFFREEAAGRPRADYMLEVQVHVNERMRAILVDWLVEVHFSYGLCSETLHLAINVIDRYLSVRVVVRRKLQLLGVTALFIASKYEEIKPPKASEFAYITDNTYTTQEIFDMECAVLNALDCKLAVPTQAQFKDRLERVNACDAQHRRLVDYILELALVEYRMLDYAPSMLVSAAIYLSNALVAPRMPLWSAAMAHHSRYQVADLRPCAEELRDIVLAAPDEDLQAVCRKFQRGPHAVVIRRRDVPM